MNKLTDEEIRAMKTRCSGCCGREMMQPKTPPSPTGEGFCATCWASLGEQLQDALLAYAPTEPRHIRADPVYNSLLGYAIETCQWVQGRGFWARRLERIQSRLERKGRWDEFCSALGWSIEDVPRTSLRLVGSPSRAGEVTRG